MFGRPVAGSIVGPDTFGDTVIGHAARTVTRGIAEAGIAAVADPKF